MIAIQRLSEPKILVDKKAIWLSNFISSGKKRPDFSKYANPAIRTQLNSMSFHKCFYCEIKLKGKRKEIDHHVEVSVNKNLSFEWTNLYLSCDNCNRKIPHSDISIQDALDPCIDSDKIIKENLTFEGEYIQAKGNSRLGLNTIKKYRLDTELLDHRRLKKIDSFKTVLIEILKLKNIEKRNYLTKSELETIHRFKSKDASFSMMFEVLINKYNI